MTFAAGVPTVWLGLLDHMKANNLRFSTLKRTLIGGAACPPAMLKRFEQEYGVTVQHAWGMTELSPVGSMVKPEQSQISRQQLEKQGRILRCLIGKSWDKMEMSCRGTARRFGDLMVRGRLGNFTVLQG